MHYLVQLGIATFSLLTALIGLLSFWVRRLYKELDEKKSTIETQTHKINDLESVVNPLRSEVNRCRQELDHANRRIHELNDSLQKKNETLAGNVRKTVELNHTLRSTRNTANRYAEIANKNYRIAKNLEKIAKDRHDTILQLQEENDVAKCEFEDELAELGRVKDEQWGERLDQEKELRIEEFNELKKEQVEVEKINTSLTAENHQLTSFRQNIEGIVSHQGRIWERALPADARCFVPRAKRNAPIIAVLNLKGGVGKTTLTANIAATLCHLGKRVLAIDLDYQRSLTQLCCKPSELKDWHNKGQCIQHFFLSVENGPIPVVTTGSDNGGPIEFILSRAIRKMSHAPNMAHLPSKKVKKISKDGLFRLVPCSESSIGDDVSGTLDDTEMHIFVDWLMRNQSHDRRLWLREALQYPPIQAETDYVLLDCPPRLSLACINALAASDFVLIPVIPDETSISSVGLLLKKMKRLLPVSGLLTSLSILGVVANKAELNAGGLLRHMAEAWGRIPIISEEAWGHYVHCFDTKIRKNAEFGRAAEANNFAIFQDPSGNVLEWFTSLTNEIEERINNECNSTPAVPAKPR